MVYVRNDWYTQAIPIMRWLQTMRNVDGGFGSTQVRSAPLVYQISLHVTYRRGQMCDPVL